MRFDGKTVIVTGGASGIGETTARAFADEGANVVIADFADAGQALAEELADGAGRALFVKTDVSDGNAIEGMIAETVRAFGSVDVLFANAGVAAAAEIADLDQALWDRTIGINLGGVYLSNKMPSPR